MILGIERAIVALCDYASLYCNKVPMGLAKVPLVRSDVVFRGFSSAPSHLNTGMPALLKHQRSRLVISSNKNCFDPEPKS